MCKALCIVKEIQDAIKYLSGGVPNNKDRLNKNKNLNDNIVFICLEIFWG